MIVDRRSLGSGLRDRLRNLSVRPADPVASRLATRCLVFTTETLDCMAYYAYFGKFFYSNQNYAIMPGVEAIRQGEWLFSVFGRNDEVFIRPPVVTSSL